MWKHFSLLYFFPEWKWRNTRLAGGYPKDYIIAIAGTNQIKNVIGKNNGADNKTEYKKKLPVTIILADSLVKEVKAWKLSNKNSKLVIMKLKL